MGKNVPMIIRWAMLKKISAAMSRARLTTADPSRLPESVKTVEPKENASEVPKAASSPI